MYSLREVRGGHDYGRYLHSRVNDVLPVSEPFCLILTNTHSNLRAYDTDCSRIRALYRQVLSVQVVVVAILLAYVGVNSWLLTHGIRMPASADPSLR